jgi:hypothetical protein
MAEPWSFQLTCVATQAQHLYPKIIIPFDKDLLITRVFLCQDHTVAADFKLFSPIQSNGNQVFQSPIAVYSLVTIVEYVRRFKPTTILLPYFNVLVATHIYKVELLGLLLEPDEVSPYAV